MATQHSSDGPHEFLSPSWIAAAQRVRDEYRGKVTPPEISVRANVVITNTPFDGDVLGSIDTSDGQFGLEPAHLEQPDLVIATDYATAKALFVDHDENAVMAALFGGKIRVQGDSTKLLAMQLPLTTPGAAEVADEVSQRLKAITA